MRSGSYKGGGWRRHSGGGGSYISPFYPNALYSLRKRNGAYAGNCIRVRRSSDGTSLDIGFIAGDYMDASALTTFVGAGDGNVIIWYDQSGNGLDVTEPSVGVRLVTAGVVETIGGHPAMNTNPTGNGFFIAANAAFAFGTGPFTLEFISRPTLVGSGNPGQATIDFRDGGSSVAAFYNQNSDSPSLFNGANNTGVLGDIANNVTAWIAAAFDGTNLSLYYAGARDYFASYSSNFVGNRPMNIAHANAGALQFFGYLLEVRITKGTAIYSGATVVPPDYYA